MLAVWLRRYLSETPVFQDLRQQRAIVEGLPIRRVLVEHRGSVVRCVVLSWLLTAGIVIVILMTPTLAQSSYGIPLEDALRANAWATLALALGCVAFGLGADRCGVDRTLIVGAISMAASGLLLFVTLTHAPRYFPLVYPLAGLCIGVVGAVPVLLVQAFPAAVRYSGISFSYNLAYALSGGLTPLIVTLWIRSTPYAPAYYVCAVVAVSVAAILLSRVHGARAHQGATVDGAAAE